MMCGFIIDPMDCLWDLKKFGELQQNVNPRSKIEDDDISGKKESFV